MNSFVKSLLIFVKIFAEAIIMVGFAFLTARIIQAIPTLPFPGFDLWLAFLLILLGMIVRQQVKKKVE